MSNIIESHNKLQEQQEQKELEKAFDDLFNK